MANRILICIVVLWSAPLAWAQTTRPTTRPSGASPTVDQMFQQLLVPNRPTLRPLEPAPNVPTVDLGGRTAVAPNAPAVNLIREGTIIFDRRGRLARLPDGQHEFRFEADGQAMKDPPMIILPNLKLMAMENAMKTSSRELRFSVTGMVTEYNGRNYILLDKAVVVPEG